MEEDEENGSEVEDDGEVEDGSEVEDDGESDDGSEAEIEGDVDDKEDISEDEDGKNKCSFLFPGCLPDLENFENGNIF